MRPMAIVAMLILAIRVCSAEKVPDAEVVKAAIADLSSEDFAERESATNLLLKMGEVVAAPVKAALDKAEDPEAKHRLTALIAKWPVGGLAWDFEAGYVFGLPVVDGGRVYVGNKDMNFFCLELESGKVLWKTPIEGMMFHSPAVADGRVYIIRTRKNGSPDGTLLCLDAKNGAQLWTFHSEDSQTFTPPMVSGGKLFLVNDDMLFCLDAASGKKIWEYQAPKTILSAPSISDGCVLVGGLDMSVHCLSVETGKHIWEFQIGDSAYAGASIAKGRAYACGNNKKVFCVDLKTGAKIWEYEGEGRTSSPPAISAGRVYYGGDDGAVTCLNSDTGEKIWVFNALGMVNAQISVCGTRLYAVSIYNQMSTYCLNAEDGKLIWTYSTKEAGYATPVLAGQRLLLGYHSKFQCIRTGMPGPDAWPMTGGNAARTGNND